MIRRRSAKRLRRRGEPVFSFIDGALSDEPFLIDRVPFTGTDEVRSLFTALAAAFLDVVSDTPVTRIYVTDPAGEVYEVASFESAAREAEWTARVKELVVELGAAGLALMANDVQFRQRYGTADQPGSSG